MEAYTDFASVYDELMDNTPYERWCDNIVKVLGEYGIRDGLVLDMGCGIIDRKCLVTHAEDEKKLFPAHPLIFFQHRQPIEQMT